MQGTADLIAIVRGGESASAVWHVDVNPSTPLARLCGAWVSDDSEVLRKVTTARIVLPFGGRLHKSAAKFASTAAGVVDINETLTIVSKVIAELDDRHRATKTAAGNQRAPIIWPRLPAPLDWEALPAAARGVDPEPFVAEMIAVARWVSDLAETWSKVETARISREHLADGKYAPRLMPVNVLPSAFN